MCHQSVGLVARQIETLGIPTVTLSVVQSMTEATPAPRNVLLRFRLGQVFGEPEAVGQQQAVLREMLRALDAATEPGQVVEAPYRWKREKYPPPVGVAARS
jgi:D-proline reductase (dithiol) PrdB